MEQSFFPIYDSQDYNHPGLCIIITQENFNQDKTKLENLLGYRTDVKSLCNTFRHFGFDLRICSNLSLEGLLQTLKELILNQDNASDHSIFKGYASLVVCILSHGGIDTVCGTDGESIKIQKLIEFIVDECPNLKGKPKLFIIHTQLRHRIIESADIADPGGRPSTSSTDTVDLNVKPLYSDIVQLLCNSFVYPKYGTRFVQSLCNHLRFFNRDKVKGLRDIYGAYQAMRQEIAKEMLTGGNCLGVNTTPILYLSTIGIEMMVGFKTVLLDKRCKEIFFYTNNSGRGSSYQDLADFLATLKNKPELVLYTSKYSTDSLTFESSGNLMKVIEDGKIEFNEMEILGNGTYSSVWKGIYLKSETKIEVAVKRVYASQIENDKLEKMLKLAPHTNIVQCFYSENDTVYRYLVLELCVCTLKEMIPTRNYKGYTIGIDDKEILLQMASGLYYLHSNEIVHRDLKPENVLFSSSTSMDTKLNVIKLADFGISRIVCADKNAEHSKKEISNETLRRFGTDGWIPHEMYTQSGYTEEKGKQADVWSLGCLFVFTLLDGKHPFGKDISSRIQLIRNKKPMLPAVEQLLEEKRADKMINSMLHEEPEKRPTAIELFKNNYFNEKESNITSPIKLKRKRESPSPKNDTSSSLSKTPTKESPKRKSIYRHTPPRYYDHHGASIAVPAAGTSNIKSRLRGQPS